LVGALTQINFTRIVTKDRSSGHRVPAGKKSDKDVDVDLNQCRLREHRLARTTGKRPRETARRTVCRVEADAGMVRQGAGFFQTTETSKTAGVAMFQTRRQLLLSLAWLGGSFTFVSSPAFAASAREIDAQAQEALELLYSTQPRARELSSRSRAILVFPRIIKAGLIIGGQSGDGVLLVGGRADGYYNISAGSFGLQAGGQRFSYALFFMNDAALRYLQNSNGWAIGSGPSVVVVNKGAAASVTSTTLKEDVYAVPFGQEGLMAGIGLEGSKITRIHPGP
jgi:lipid-binding SYLF domain-containing protein